jgi:hypothetical protein
VSFGKYVFFVYNWIFCSPVHLKSKTILMCSWISDGIAHWAEALFTRAVNQRRCTDAQNEGNNRNRRRRPSAPSPPYSSGAQARTPRSDGRPRCPHEDINNSFHRRRSTASRQPPPSAAVRIPLRFPISFAGGAQKAGCRFHIPHPGGRDGAGRRGARRSFLLPHAQISDSAARLGAPPH